MNEDAMVAENMPLVTFVIKRHFPASPWNDDMFQVGCMGLLYAIRKFNPDKGCTLSTYAVRCITSYLGRYVRDMKSPKRSGKVCISFDDVIYQGDEGRDITLRDLVPSPAGEPSGVPLLIAEARKRLTKREWDIVELKAAGYTQQEIGTALGVTQVHISRILCLRLTRKCGELLLRGWRVNEPYILLR